MRRLLLLMLALLLLLWSGTISAQPSDPLDLSDYPDTMKRMVDEFLESIDFQGSGTAVVDAVARSGDPLYIAPLIDLGFFTRSGRFEDIANAVFLGLENLTGLDYGRDWTAYFEWASENDIALPPGYDAFKGDLFGTLIDEDFYDFFRDVQDTAEINLIEAVWGGVRVDGIPSLVNARQITPEEARIEGETLNFCRRGDCTYPADDELVFGVTINGDSRAYPLRLLNWHEMFNDVIGAAPLYAAPEVAPEVAPGGAPNGEALCNFRAPTEFQAVQRSGDAWVQIAGLSAGCPSLGWLQDPASLVWNDGTWDDIKLFLPDIATNPDAERLSVAGGIRGHVSGTPVMLAYCTLCGAGVLYNPIIGTDEGETVLEFGSSGLLMRSNKLMYDRNTRTIWNAITGEPAFGPLAGSGIQLERLPVVVSDWATWYAEHPDTSVLSLNTGYPRDYTNGAAYAEYFNNPDFLMFPVFQQDESENQNKEVVFTLLIDDTPKAYPLRLLVEETVINDTLAGQDLVIVTRQTPDREFFEPGGATVRAYDAGGLTFSAGESHREVIDENGVVWSVTEGALIHPDGERLPRVAGHLSFWFGWYGFYPDTLVYGMVLE